MRKPRRFCLGMPQHLAATSALALVANTAHPQLPTASEPQAPLAAASLCHDDPTRTQSTLAYLACSLRDGLPRLSADTIVIARPLTEGGPDLGRAFGERLSRLLSSAAGTRDGGVATNPGQPGGDRPVLLLEARVHGGQVEVNATLQGKQASVWAKVRGETTRVLAHTFASKAIDSELRSYLPAAPLVRPTVHTYAAPLAEINAIACGDLDEDGALELAIANRQSLAWGILTPQGLVARHAVPWSDLSEIATVPLRQPLAALWIDGARLEAATTDRRYWVQLNGSMDVTDKRANQWSVGPGLCTSRAAPFPQGAVFPCIKPPKLSEVTDPTLDALVVDDSPAVETHFVAKRNGLTQEVSIELGGRSWHLPERGSQLALADLNGDGTEEVVTTSSTLVRAKDHLALHSLTEASTPLLVWELPVPTGIDALAVCPFDGTAPRTIVFATNDHIGVVR